MSKCLLYLLYMYMYCQESQVILLQTSLWCFAFTKVSDNIIEILRFQYIWFYAHDNHSCSILLQIKSSLL